jgi:hypothetical protein
VAARIAAAAIVQYHTAMERQRFIEGFKAQHPDFDNYREDMLAILRMRPDLDQNPGNLPIVFEMAKQRYAKRLDDMKSAMGIATPAPTPTPAPAATPAPVTMTEEQMAAMEARMLEKAKAALLEEAKKRRAAQGTLGGSTTTPTARVAPTATVKPKTPADEIFDEMLASGNKAADFLKNL